MSQHDSKTIVPSQSCELCSVAVRPRTFIAKIEERMTMSEGTIGYQIHSTAYLYYNSIEKSVLPFTTQRYTLENELED